MVRTDWFCISFTATLLYKITFMHNKFFFSISVLVFLGLSFASCSKTEDPVGDEGTNVTFSSKTISGKLVHRVQDLYENKFYMTPWDLGATKIHFSYSTTETVVTADVAADGSFTAVLPSTLSSDHFYSPSLELQMDPTPASLKKTIVPMLITVDLMESGVALYRNVNIGDFTDDTFRVPKTFYAIYCFDREGSVKGTHSFSGDHYNLNAVKGWNFMFWDQTETPYTYTLTTNLPQGIYIYI